MKKLFLLFALIPLFLSCDNESDTSWDVIPLSVRQSQWVLNTDDDGLNPYYSCTFDMPEISLFIYEQGLVQTYIWWDNGQQVLPFVRHKETIEDSVLYRWTETVDYDYAAGSLSFYVTYSDFVDVLPPAMDFRVVLMW